jgi:hypothetical protein
VSLPSLPSAAGSISLATGEQVSELFSQGKYSGLVWLKRELEDASRLLISDSMRRKSDLPIALLHSNRSMDLTVDEEATGERQKVRFYTCKKERRVRSPLEIERLNSLWCTADFCQHLPQYDLQVGTSFGTSHSVIIVYLLSWYCNLSIIPFIHLLSSHTTNKSPSPSPPNPYHNRTQQHAQRRANRHIHHKIQHHSSPLSFVSP